MHKEQTGRITSKLKIRHKDLREELKRIHEHRENMHQLCLEFNTNSK